MSERELIDIVWLACAVDSEGTLDLTSTGKYKGRVYKHPRLALYNTNLEFVSHARFIVRDKIGIGTVRPMVRPDSLGKKTVYVFTVSGRKILPIVREILPYLIVKRDSASELLKWVPRPRNQYTVERERK